MPSCFMSTSSPVLPSTPHDALPSWACLARRAVSVRITLAPQFWMSVRGMTSKERASARNGHWVMPVIDLAFSSSNLSKTKTKCHQLTIFNNKKTAKNICFILTDVIRIGIWPKIDPIWGANDFTVFGVIFLFDGYGWFGFKKNSKLWRHMTFTSFLFIFLVKVKNFLIYNKNKST